MNLDAIAYFLESLLGVGKKTSRENRAFYCPKCKHHKRKLEINLITQKWQCWVCGQNNSFRGKTIKSLLHKLEVPSSKYLELKYILPENPGEEVLVDETKVKLPEEFLPLADFKSSDPFIGGQAKRANSFLLSRGITYAHLLSYNIGFCPSGKYANRIIIPSYNSIGELNYFIARSYIEGARKYDNPAVSRNIIGMEYYINWDAPIILVEGAFDAITLRRNAIPLFGKNISKELMIKLITGDVKKIYVALDNDAKKDAIKHCEKLMSMGKEVYFVDLGKDKDFNEMGFENSIKILEKVEPFDFKQLIKLKLF